MKKHVIVLSLLLVMAPQAQGSRRLWSTNNNTASGTMTSSSSQYDNAMSNSMMPSGSQSGNAMLGSMIGSDSHTSMRLEMQKLWATHILWAGKAIDAAIAGTPEITPAIQRLMETQNKMGNLFTTYYGKKIGDQIAALLKEHVTATGNVLNTVIAQYSQQQQQPQQQQQQMNRAYKRWLQSTSAIADFLAKINPNWNQDTLTTMMYERLRFYCRHIHFRITQNWKALDDNTEQMLNHMLAMSKELTDGIIKQLPEKPSYRS